MLTFQDQYEQAQEITEDYSASRLIIFKRDINQGGTLFLNALGRKFNKEYKTANLEEDQQYYQFSSDVLRISKVRCLHGSFYYTPTLVTSEEEWDRLNAITTSGNYPTHYYIRGFKEVGLWPVPSSDVANGLEVSYEPQHVLLTQADYTTGTITASNGSVAVTHSDDGFTQQMVGRFLQVTDGTDGKWYRVASFVSTSQVNLENFYEGISGSGRSFRIGEVMKIPQGYHDAPVAFALHKYYLSKKDKASAAFHLNYYKDQLKSAKATYGKSTSQAGVKTRPTSRRPSWIDLTPPVTYP